MKTYIALLSGINVGGNTSFLMADLRALYTEIGLENVRTFIQSCNVIFRSSFPEEILIEKMEQAIQVKIPVFLRTVEELELVINNNPFPDGIPSQIGVMFFVDPLPKISEFTKMDVETIHASTWAVFSIVGLNDKVDKKVVDETYARIYTKWG